MRLARTGSDEKDDEDVKGEEKTGKAGKRKKEERKSQEGNGKVQGRRLATNLETEGQGGTETARKGNDKAKDTGIEVATLGWFWKTRAHPRQHLPKETTMEVEL